MKKFKEISAEKLYKFFIYFCLSIFALSILIPIGWAIMSAFKYKSEFYGNPWVLPEGLYFENFVKAFTEAHMGEYFVNSLIITGLSLVLLLVVAVPAAYVLCIIKKPSMSPAQGSALMAYKLSGKKIEDKVLI